MFWRQRPPSPEHVSGNLRAVLRDIFRQRVTREWKCAPAQGELVREHGERLTRWLDVVRRAGNGVHLLVALQLSTLQTSTPSRFALVNLLPCCVHSVATLPLLVIPSLAPVLRLPDVFYNIRSPWPFAR